MATGPVAGARPPAATPATPKSSPSHGISTNFHQFSPATKFDSASASAHLNSSQALLLPLGNGVAHACAGPIDRLRSLVRRIAEPVRADRAGPHDRHDERG